MVSLATAVVTEHNDTRLSIRRHDRLQFEEITSCSRTFHTFFSLASTEVICKYVYVKPYRFFPSRSRPTAQIFGVFSAPVEWCVCFSLFIVSGIVANSPDTSKRVRYNLEIYISPMVRTKTQLFYSFSMVLPQSNTRESLDRINMYEVKRHTTTAQMNFYICMVAVRTANASTMECRVCHSTNNISNNRNK